MYDAYEKGTLIKDGTLYAHPGITSTHALARLTHPEMTERMLANCIFAYLTFVHVDVCLCESAGPPNVASGLHFCIKYKYTPQYTNVLSINGKPC